MLNPPNPTPAKNWNMVSTIENRKTGDRAIMFPAKVSQRQVKHYGLDNASKHLVNGSLLRESDRGTQADPLNGWKIQSLPTVNEVLSWLMFPVRDFNDITYIEELMGEEFTQKEDPAIGGHIPLSRMLSAKGISRTYGWDHLPVKWQTVPRLVAGIAIAGDLFLELSPEVLEFAKRLEWRKTPSVVRIGSDIYKAESACVLLKTEPKTISRVRAEHRLMDEKAQHSPNYKPGKFIEATAETQRQLAELGLSHAIAYTYEYAEIRLVPSPHRGKHIARVVLQDLRDRSLSELGSIRHHNGKLKFYAPNWVYSDRARQQLAEEMRAYSGSKQAYQENRERLQSQQAALGQQITALQSQVRQRKTTRSKSLEDLQRLTKARDAIAYSLSQMSKPVVEAESICRLPEDLVHPVMALLNGLGLQPNGWVRSLPKDSPLNSVRFWFDNFGIVTHFPHPTKPVEFVSDRRNCKAKF